MTEEMTAGIMVSNTLQAKIEALEEQLREEHAKAEEEQHSLKDALGALKEQVQEEHAKAEEEHAKAQELKADVREQRARVLRGSQGTPGEAGGQPTERKVAALVLEGDRPDNPHRRNSLQWAGKRRDDDRDESPPEPRVGKQHTTTWDMTENMKVAKVVSNTQQAKIEALEEQLREEHAKAEEEHAEAEDGQHSLKDALEAVKEQLQEEHAKAQEEHAKAQEEQRKADALEQRARALRGSQGPLESGAAGEVDGQLTEKVAALMLERGKLQSKIGTQAALIKQLQEQAARGRRASEARGRQAGGRIQELERNVTALARERNQTQEALIQARRDVDTVIAVGVKKLRDMAELDDKQEAYGRSLEAGLEEGRQKLLGHRDE